MRARGHCSAREPTGDGFGRPLDAMSRDSGKASAGVQRLRVMQSDRTGGASSPAVAS
ncbi:hypothetical protein LMG28727_04802 [Paraburkholderia kirstenboschensis]|nr:hypothetical protein LMG28727_04802 [Paraburkholderia kirstenboschensis]